MEFTTWHDSSASNGPSLNDGPDTIGEATSIDHSASRDPPQDHSNQIGDKNATSGNTKTGNMSSLNSNNTNVWYEENDLLQWEEDYMFDSHVPTGLGDIKIDASPFNYLGEVKLNEKAYGQNSHVRDLSSAFSMKNPLVETSHHDVSQDDVFTSHLSHETATAVTSAHSTGSHVNLRRTDSAAAAIAAHSPQHHPHPLAGGRNQQPISTPIRVHPGARGSPMLNGDSPTYLGKGLESPMEFKALQSPHMGYQLFPNLPPHSATVLPHSLPSQGQLSRSVTTRDRRNTGGSAHSRRTSSNASSISSPLLYEAGIDDGPDTAPRTQAPCKLSRRHSLMVGSAAAPRLDTGVKLSYVDVQNDVLKTPLQETTPVATPLTNQSMTPGNRMFDTPTRGVGTPSLMGTPSMGTPSMLGTPTINGTPSGVTPHIEGTETGALFATPGKEPKRDTRKRIGKKQIELLESFYHENPRPERADRQRLAEDTGLEQRTVQIWFQNRRAKARALKMPPSKADVDNKKAASAAAASAAAASALTAAAAKKAKDAKEPTEDTTNEAKDTKDSAVKDTEKPKRNRKRPTTSRTTESSVNSDTVAPVPQSAPPQHGAEYSAQQPGSTYGNMVAPHSAPYGATKMRPHQRSQSLVVGPSGFNDLGLYPEKVNGLGFFEPGQDMHMQDSNILDGNMQNSEYEFWSSGPAVPNMGGGFMSNPMLPDGPPLDYQYQQNWADGDMVDSQDSEHMQMQMPHQQLLPQHQRMAPRIQQMHRMQNLTKLRGRGMSSDMSVQQQHAVQVAQQHAALSGRRVRSLSLNEPSIRLPPHAGNLTPQQQQHLVEHQRQFQHFQQQQHHNDFGPRGGESDADRGYLNRWLDGSNRSDSITSLASINSAIPPNPQNHYSPNQRNMLSSPETDSVGTQWMMRGADHLNRSKSAATLYTNNSGNNHYNHAGGRGGGSFASSTGSGSVSSGSGMNDAMIRFNQSVFNNAPEDYGRMASMNGSAPGWGNIMGPDEDPQYMSGAFGSSWASPTQQWHGSSFSSSSLSLPSAHSVSTGSGSVKSSHWRSSTQTGPRSRQPSIRLQLDESNNSAQIVVVEQEEEQDGPETSQMLGNQARYWSKEQPQLTRDMSPGRAEQAAERLLAERATSATQGRPPK